jgi:small subunit ribosomal protein S6
MPLYESVFIARQDISAQQVETLSDQFAELVSHNGGEVKKREYWGLRNLAYRIKKNRKGHYVLFNLDAPPAALAEMERNMRINEDVLRYQSVRIEEIEEGPSPIMAAKGRRDRDSVSPYEGMEP